MDRPTGNRSTCRWRAASFSVAPLVDGGDLFVVGERNLDVRLYVLDPQTGRVRWSQLLAHSDTKIDQDLGRRWWTVQVAYSNGILVCPTTVGWLVAVDRLDHSVLWMNRYAPPAPRRRSPTKESRGMGSHSFRRCLSTINGARRPR